MNLTLIGMSGAGKSYVGKRAAAQRGLAYLDIDKEIERTFEKPLHELLEEWGDERFIREESAATIKIATDADNALFSTGGSVIYSPAAMEHLRAVSKVIYLAALPDLLMERIAGDAVREGRIVGLKDKTLAALIKERLPLYEKHAHERFDTTGMSLDEVVQQLETVC